MCVRRIVSEWKVHPCQFAIRDPLSVVAGLRTRFCSRTTEFLHIFDLNVWRSRPRLTGPGIAKLVHKPFRPERLNDYKSGPLKLSSCCCERVSMRLNKARDVARQSPSVTPPDSPSRVRNV